MVACPKWLVEKAEFRCQIRNKRFTYRKAVNEPMIPNFSHIASSGRQIDSRDSRRGGGFYTVPCSPLAAPSTWLAPPSSTPPLADSRQFVCGYQQKSPTANGEAFQSGRPDLNRRPLRPERSALPNCATPRAVTIIEDAGWIARIWLGLNRAYFDGASTAGWEIRLIMTCLSSKTAVFMPTDPSC